MKIICANDYQSMSRQAANIISAHITLKPDSVLGLATGSTPVGIYKQLIDWYKRGDLDFSQVTTVNLDEYCGLGGNHSQSYRYFMNYNLFNYVNINMNKTYVPNGTAKNLQKECERYDSLIASLGDIDLQLLGIGHNGHIGFNEPNIHFFKNTHVVDLDQSTIDANARFFGSADKVPKQAITMGIQSIMAAKKILLVVNGADKREILERALYGPVTPQVPASLLQMHTNLTVICSDL